MPQIIKKVFSLSTLALLTALTLSGIAAWYSVVGLTAIFAAAIIPIIIMGGALEFAKVVTTVWLHRYWDKCKWAMKTYLTVAVAVLALVTSMGIFGFLSKAHMDQGVPTGDIAAQISLFDEKIATVKENIKVQRDNIAQSRAALAQMDNQVNARLDRGSSEQSAERAVQIRRQQASERKNINNDITTAQKEIEKLNKQIADLNAEKAPISAKFRKVEAEVGPIKYIAALIYGDNPDQALLERAVRWVIILLIFVFDPLALMLVIAAISSYKWEFEVREEKPTFAVSGPGYMPLDPTEKEDYTPIIEKEIVGEPKAGTLEMTADGGFITPKKKPVKKKFQEKFQNIVQQARQYAQQAKEKFNQKNNQKSQAQKESQKENLKSRLNKIQYQFNQLLNNQSLIKNLLNKLKK